MILCHSRILGFRALVLDTTRNVHSTLTFCDPRIYHFSTPTNLAIFANLTHVHIRLSLTSYSHTTLPTNSSLL